MLISLARRTLELVVQGHDWRREFETLRTGMPVSICADMMVATQVLQRPHFVPVAISERVRTVGYAPLASALELRSDDRERRLNAGSFWVDAIRDAADGAARTGAPMTNIPLFLFEAIMSAAKLPVSVFASFLSDRDLFRVWMLHSIYVTHTGREMSDYVLAVTNAAYCAERGPSDEDVLLLTAPFAGLRFGLAIKDAPDGFIDAVRSAEPMCGPCSQPSV